MATMVRLGILVLVLALLTACGAGAQPRERAMVRDSAGITIVENSVGLWRKGEAWRLTEAPLVEIGVLDGEPEYQLYQVTGATRLADGRIVVANGGTRELRFYDGDGRFLRSVGRQGAGPGEFRGYMGLHVGGDSLYAFDSDLRRVSVFDQEGRFARSFVLEGPTSGASPFMRGVFSDRSVLVSGSRPFRYGEERGGVARRTVSFWRYGPDGVQLDSIGSFPGSESYVHVTGGSMSVMSLAFGKELHQAIHGMALYIGTTDHYEIGRYAADGTLERLIRRPNAVVAVTPEDIRRYRAELLEAMEMEFRQDFASMMDAMPYPETFPAYQRLATDPAGNLWVEEYRRPGDDQPRWTVFDPSGQMLGTVDMPSGFTSVEIGNDYVLGIWKDEFDVEHVRLYGLTKPRADDLAIR